MRYRKVCLENTWKHSKFPTVQPFLSPFAEGGSMTPSFLGWISWRTDQRSPLIFSKWGHSSDWCRKITSSSHYVWNWSFFCSKGKKSKQVQYLLGPSRTHQGFMFHVTGPRTAYSWLYGSWGALAADPKWQRRSGCAMGQQISCAALGSRFKIVEEKTIRDVCLFFLFMGMTRHTVHIDLFNYLYNCPGSQKPLKEWPLELLIINPYSNTSLYRKSIQILVFGLPGYVYTPGNITSDKWWLEDYFPFGKGLFSVARFNFKWILFDLFLYYTRWWFQVSFIFTATWGNDPIWLIFFKWVETTN